MAKIRKFYDVRPNRDPDVIARGLKLCPPKKAPSAKPKAAKPKKAAPKPKPKTTKAQQ